MMRFYQGSLWHENVLSFRCVFDLKPKTSGEGLGFHFFCKKSGGHGASMPEARILHRWRMKCVLKGRLFCFFPVVGVLEYSRGASSLHFKFILNKINLYYSRALINIKNALTIQIRIDYDIFDRRKYGSST